MNIVFCTSFGQSYYESIAQHTLPLMIRALKDYRLLVYYENSIQLTSNINQEYVQYNNLFHCSDALVKFLISIKSDKLKQGLEYQERHAEIWNHKQKAGGYNYKLNAFVFARKWFAIQHAFMGLMRQHDEFVLVWLDADILFYDYPITFNAYASRLLLKDQIAYLAREWCHSECGFMMFKSGGASLALINSICSMYSTHAVFNEQEWHDSYIFDVIKERMDNMCFVKMAESNVYGEDVFSKCFLADFAAHMKGSLKGKIRDNIRDGKHTYTAPQSA